MKLRLITLLGVLLAALTVLAAPAASASTSARATGLGGTPQPTRLVGGPDASVNVDTFCQAGTDECLNLTLCDIDKAVQLWNVYNGRACSENWYVQFVGYVDPSATFPFYCGRGINSTYKGDPVFEVKYAASTGGAFVPISAGFNMPVYVSGVGDGYFVAQDPPTGNNVLHTRLIDVETTCDTLKIQHLYAGCGGDGCLIRDGENPATQQYWDWDEFNLST
jgi:hypothetical protein